MNLSIGQILIILVVGFLLFGDIPKRVESIRKVIESFKK